jgi:ATP-dependent protease ClpP protease subunit
MKRPIQVFNFSIKNTGNETVDIHIDGDIVDASTQELLKSWLGNDTSVSFKSFRNQVNEFDAKTYNIYINSYGGLVTDAMAMHDFLAELETKGKTVNRIGRGIVASSGTYILMGNNSSMTKNSWMMIHNVSGGIYGDVDTVENYAATLRKFNNRSRDFYAEFTQMRKEDISRLMNSETWMTADEAFEKGFIKNVIGAENFTNAIPKENWQFANMAVLNAYNSSVKTPPTNSENIQTEEMKKLFNDFATTVINAIKGVKVDEKTDNQTIVNNIAEAVGKSFEGLGDQMETSVNEIVNNASKEVDFTADGPAKTALDTAVNNAVTNATKDMNTKITSLETTNADLKKKNDDLETEIKNMKGKQTNSGQPEGGKEEKKQIGKFVEG